MMKKWTQIVSEMVDHPPQHIIDAAVDHIMNEYSREDGGDMFRYSDDAAEIGYDRDNETVESPDGEELSVRTPEGRNILNAAVRAYTEAAVNDAFYEFEHLFRNGQITIYREITAPADWDQHARHPGIYWSWDRHAAEAHWGNFSSGHVKWLLEATVDESKIDWVMTLAMNGNSSYAEEKEIRLIRDADITFTASRVS